LAKRQVFYSFHFDNDVFRVQQVRNIGALEDNKPVSVNDWEAVKKKGDAAIEKWIDDNMRYRGCVVVLVGEQTAGRKWVQYDIHNLKDPKNGTCTQGTNPFSQWTFKQSGRTVQIACYNPSAWNAYSEIAKNLEDWVQVAITQRS
jgi:MTH538 TIR-like domain (DUF1863)